MPLEGVSGFAVAATAAGTILLWSGIKGANISKTFQSLAGGKQPAGTTDMPVTASFDSAGNPVVGGSSGGPAPAVAGTYSHAQLEQLWRSQGGAGATANIAAAVAQAESGGQPNAVNHNSDGSTDRGLWQINSVHGAQSVFDPQANARAAISISSNGLNWSPWTTFQSGAYRKFLGAS